MNKIDKMLAKHQGTFRQKAWQEYSPPELAQWVALFSKRSTHRSDKTRALSDIKNAENYLMMLRQQIRSSL